MKMRLRGTLVWKLYVIGFVQLLVLGATVVGVGWLLVRQRLPAPGPEVQSEPGLSSPMLRPPRHPFAGMRPRPFRPPPPLEPLLVFLVSGFLIVGVGSFLTARWVLSPIKTLSLTANALGSGDLRARAKLSREDEFGELGRAFDEMAERLQHLVLAERELLASISHELRTPLARLSVALDLAEEAGGNAGQAPLHEMHQDIAEIESLIDDILTTVRLDLELGRAPSSGFSLHLERVTPAELCERAAERFAARHPDRPLVTDFGEKLPTLSVDPALFRRVLDNLLENADKYTTVARVPIALRAHARDECIVFEVADRGIGIAPEDVPRVFTPFFRGERSRSRSGGGVGLGLTLAKRIVDAHDGIIEIDSAVGRGTTVCVSLPTHSVLRKD
jgi:signal transduction histidine kinase